jgi:hypothetical protein
MAKNIKQSESKQWRFYRSNLSTIVWNPDKENVLADFSQGHFTTDDEKVALKLRSLGYPEIALDAESPPDIVVNQPTMVIEGDVPIIHPMEDERNVEKKMSFRMREVNSPKTVATEEQKPKKSSARAIPRRRKQTN